MELMESILTRRSTRKMKTDLPPLELIEKVVEAGRYAPSGSNRQATHFIVITKKKALDDLKRLVREEYEKAGRTASAAFHYNAPVLIITANQRDSINALADSACALENMMLMANALDLGSCWINQLRRLSESEAVRAYMEPLGLGENEWITGALSLGYPDGPLLREPLPRTGNPVTWVTDEAIQ